MFDRLRVANAVLTSWSHSRQLEGAILAELLARCHGIPCEVGVSLGVVFAALLSTHFNCLFINRCAIVSAPQ